MFGDLDSRLNASRVFVSISGNFLLCEVANGQTDAQMPGITFGRVAIDVKMQFKLVRRIT